MAITKKINFNIDKLKICFKQPDGLFKKFAEYEKGQSILGDGYSLYLISDDDDQHINISVSVGGEKLGTLTLNNTKQCEGLCFFKYENNALYSLFYTDPFTRQRYSNIGLLEGVADCLGLVYNNITELEIAADANFNIVSKVRKHIRNYENYEMFVNGSKIKEPTQRLANYHETFSRSRKRLEKVPSIYFEQSRNDAPLMRIYDKTKEIEANNNSKDYISEWNGFTPIFRAEVRLKSNSIKEFLSTYQLADGNSIFYAIQQTDFLSSAWQFFTNKLVFFRNKEGENINLFDIVVR